MEKEQFLVKLRKLVELGRSKQNALDVAEINDFFTGDNLGPEQMDEIYSYLEKCCNACENTANAAERVMFKNI